jgi:hypothetical protein
MKRQKILTVSLNILILSLALACIGGGTPVAISDIPVYAGATATKAGDDPLVDMVVESMKEATSGEDITMETKTYALPDDATWDDVKNFYTDKLAGSDWKPADELTDESEEFKTIGWQRGPSYKEQLLIIAYLPDILGEGATMVIMLFTE